MDPQGWGWGPGGQWGPPDSWPPRCPPGPGWDWNWRPPLGAIRGPITGVTDGSFARPGEVGEFLTASVNQDMAYIAGQPTTTVVAPLALPPGDWDVQAEFACGNDFVDFGAGLSPLPQGASGSQYVNWGVNPPASLIYMRSAANPIRVSSAVPVLLSYTLAAELLATSVSLATGTVGAVAAYVTISARRMR